MAPAGRPWNPLRNEADAFRLLVATIRAYRGHYSPEHHHGVEIPGIYWHFVDVMWVLVFATVYLL